MRFATLLSSVAILVLLVIGCAPVRIPTSDSKATPKATTANTFALPNPFAPQPTPTVAPLKPKVLRINIGTRPDVLDPQRASTIGEVAVLQMAYEGLTRLDEKGRVLPGAAASWEFTNGGKTLTFHLRDGLVRADGTLLTAKDFEFAFKHAVDPRMGAIDSSFLNDVRGALAAYSLDPKSKLDDIQKALDNVGIAATDDTTLVVTLDQPAGVWPTIAATWVGWPSDRKKVGTDPDAWWFKPENHNGNGPFKIAEIQETVVKFVPNPNYWGGQPKLDRVEFYWIPEPGVALSAYLKGELDVIRVTSDTLAQVQSDPALNPELYRGPAAWVTYLGFNVKKAPFSDKNVRKAFSQALDRAGFVREILKGLGQPYLSLIPPGLPGYDESATVHGYDPQAAIKTLVDAGYGTPDKRRVDCNKLGTVKLSYSSTPRNQTMFQYLAGNLTRVFACPVLLDPVDPSTYPTMIKDAKTAPQFYLITWQQEYSHPQDWLFLQTCSGVYATRVGYCSKEFDAAFAAATQELDFDTSIEKYKAAQKIFIGDAAGAFLWNNENAFLIKPYVRGLWDRHGTGDNAWPGQYGPVLTYDVDTSKVGAGYPAQ
ncbi:MAG: peptide ABC transporter substrate-binding protein [Chloroflexi bacterium]|nr:peptide ABC transporter substrate-binding protein [Chloroflexota bacterium]